jgi:hypothetical protein
MRFNGKHYVPALKWRQGEFRALADLTGGQKTGLTPLLEVPPIPWDFENGVPSRTIDQHLAQVIPQINTNWGQAAAFLDVESVQIETLQSGLHPIQHLVTQGASSGIDLIPVIGLDRDTAYISAVQALVAGGISEICVRLRSSSTFSQTLDNDLGALLQTLGITIDRVHLILDFQALDGTSANLILAALPLAVNASQLIGQAATRTFMATAFPPNLSDIDPGIGSINRLEWSLWLQLRASMKVEISFGDYAISHYESQELDPRTMRVSASIRYTSTNEWVIFRGFWLQHPSHGGYTQYYALCQQIVAHPAYSGQNFSAGDATIWNCAQQSAGTGNLTTWRQVGTNHHLVFVVHQISILP